MYAKIVNNHVVEYPLYEGDLEKRFPNLKFPMDIHNTPIPDGYVRIQPSEYVYTSHFTELVEQTPIQVNGVWKQNIVEIPLSQSEIELKKPYVIAQIKQERNKRLASTDWTQCADVPMSAEKKEAYRLYRQLLRDLPTLSNFPMVVQWPTEPQK